MNLIDALNASAYDAVTYTNQNGIAWNVDGSGDGWFVTSGVDGMPSISTQIFATREQAIASLPPSIALADGWEEIEGEI